MLTAAQARTVKDDLEAAIVAALTADPWFQPTGVVHEYGDTADQLSGWDLTGLSASNSDDGWLYWSLASDLGYAVVFDDTKLTFASATQAASAGDFDFGLESFTISAWFKTDDNTQPAINEQVIWSSRYAAENHRVNIGLQTAQPFVVIDGRKLGGTYEHIISTIGIAQDTWAHILGVVDREADELRLYVNGVEAGTPVDISGFPTLTIGGTYFIGSLVAGIGPFDGSIRDIRVWKGTALTGAQAAVEAANTDPFLAVTETPTWGAGFLPGSGTTITSTWGNAVFTFAPGGNAPAWGESVYGSPHTVSIYSDSSHTGLVAQGSVVGDGAITLTAQNGSGLSGSVTLAYSAEDDDTANKLSAGLGGIRTIEQKWIASENRRWWTDILPALVVACGNSREGESGTHGRYSRQVPVTIEYLHQDGDITAIDAELGAVVERLMRWVHDQYHTSGARFNSYLDTANGVVQQIEPIEPARVPATEDQAVFFFSGGITFAVTVLVAT